MRTRLRRKLLAAAIGIGMALLAVEGALRLAGVAPPGFQPYPRTHVRGLFVARDDDRGYGYQPSFSCEVQRAGRTTTVTTNADGFRDRSFDDQPAAARRILTVGCSLTAGWGLEAEESWPRQLEHALNEAAPERPARVFNAGVTGYNMRQARRTAEQLLDRVRPEVVVMGLYPMGYDRLAMPFTVYEGYLVRDAQVPRLRLEDDGFFQSLFRGSAMQSIDHAMHRWCWIGAFALRAAGNAKRAAFEERRGPDLSRDAVAANLAPLHDEAGALAAACAARGIRFAALIIAIQEDDGSYSDFQHLLDELTVDYCHGRALLHVPTLSAFAAEAGGAPLFKLPGDLHWSARAHRRGAELMAAALHANGQ